MNPPRRVVSEKVVQAWAEAGVFGDGDEWMNYRRVVLDLRAGQAPVLYIEKYGDERLIGVGITLDEVTISFDGTPS